MILRQIVATVVMLLTAGAVQSQQPSAFTLEFEVAGMSCGSCAASATRALEQIPGVTSANVDFASKRGRVEASRQLTKDELRRALGTLGFEARFPGDAVVKPLTESERATLDIAVASRGEAIDIRKHLAPGKITIFDFWAEWCGPCHLLTPKLERLVLEQNTVALRTIDITKWESPVGKQMTKQFKLPALPYVRIYGPQGEFLGEVVGNDFEKVKQIVNGAKRG